MKQLLPYGVVCLAVLVALAAINFPIRSGKVQQAVVLPASAVPVPKDEDWWHDMHADLVRKAEQGPYSTVFFGDSITNGMNQALLHATFGPHAANFGIPGDRTEHLLWRFQHGELNFSKAPATAVVLIGTNNLTTDRPMSAEELHKVFLGVQADVQELSRQLPNTRVLVLGVLPRENSSSHIIRNEIKTLNAEIATLADNRQVFYTDIGSAMLEPDGTLSPDVMGDFLHPSPEVGYTRMFNAIKAYIDTMPH